MAPVILDTQDLSPLVGKTNVFLQVCCWDSVCQEKKRKQKWLVGRQTPQSDMKKIKQGAKF